MRQDYFPGLQVLRGFAALLVVVQHAGFFAAQTAGANVTNLVKIDFGTLGVLMFFTISGFVIGLNRHLGTAEFITRRALRIYPAFWAAFALSAAIVAIAGKETGFSFSAFFLLPSRGYPTLFVPAWTLVFEVFFYALAAAVFSLRLSDRVLTSLALLWIIVIQNMHPYMTGTLMFLPGALIPFAQYNQFFALGLICALNLDTFGRFSINQLLIAAIAATAVLPLLPGMTHVTTLLVLGVGLAALVLVLTRVPRWPLAAVLLGDASYGLFLLHYSVIVTASALLAGTGFSAWTLWPILLAIGIATGVPFGLAEYALHRRVTRAVRGYFVSGRAEPAADAGQSGSHG
jgi:exopolysaccharide production protein ExoZ